MLASFFGERDDAAEKQLFVICEKVLLANVLISCVWPLHHLHSHHYEVALTRVRHLKSLLHMIQRVVIAHDYERVAGSHLYSLVRDDLLLLQTKLIHFDVRSRAALSFIYALGDEEDAEEDEREGNAAN